MGFWEFGGGRVRGKGWDRGGQLTSNLRPRWTVLSQLGGFQVSREGLERGAKGSKEESARGDKKQGECAMYIAICVRVYIYVGMLGVIERYQLYICITIIIGMNVVDNLNSV